MGIEIQEMSILDGAVTVEHVYTHIRDICITKKDGGYKLIFSVFFKLNNKTIDAKSIEKMYDEVPEEEIWDLSYSLLKEILSEDGLEFEDV
jgi:threonyl-tRNA synthetase